MFKKEAEDNKPPYAFCTFNTKCELWKDGFQGICSIKLYFTWGTK